LTAGGLLGVVGAALVWLIAANWDACVAAAKFSGAAQAVTAAGGLCLIGALLAFAGRPHGRQHARPSPFLPDPHLNTAPER
jgi:ACS family hexuronate transporter-like MFS transporter